MKVDQTKQVKMVKETHQRIKVFSAVKGRKFYEVVDTACHYYLDSLEKTAGKVKKK